MTGKQTVVAVLIVVLVGVLLLLRRSPSAPDTVANVEGTERTESAESAESEEPLRTALPTVDAPRRDEERRGERAAAPGRAIAVAPQLDTARGSIAVAPEEDVTARPEVRRLADSTARTDSPRTDLPRTQPRTDSPRPDTRRVDPPRPDSNALAFDTFVQRRIPRSGFRPTMASHIEPAIVDPFDSFQVRHVSLDDFPAALTTHRRTRERKALARAASGGPHFQAAGPGMGAALWDQMTVRASSTRNRPRYGAPTHDSWYDLTLARLLDTGRIDLGAQVGDRNSDLYLARGYLGFESRTGWLAAVGDQAVGYSGTGLHGTTARGLRTEYAQRVSGAAPAWKAGLLVGDAAVQHTNLVAGTFPRRLETGYVSVEQSRRQSLEGVAYRFSDRGAAASPSADGIESGSGLGLAGSFRRTGVDVRAELAESSVQFETGDERRGRAGNFRARGDLGPASLSGRLQETDGVAYEMGSLGALQQIPQRIEDVNLSLRPGGGTGVSVWSGRWRYAPDVLPDTTGSNVERQSLHGDRWGGRFSWRSPKGGSGFSASQEFRHRSLANGSEDVVTQNVSLSQRIRRGLNAKLIWNQLDYSNRDPYTYVTGSVSTRLGKGGTFTLQQRTLWQEPLGPRLESIADLSSIRAADGRLLLGVQLAVRHEEQSDGRFHRVQTQGRVSGDYRLGRNVRLAGRYQLSHSPSGDVHGIEFALSHQLGRSSDTFSGSGLDPVRLDGQIVTGRVFEDQNRDGKWQTGEPGIAGVEIAIDEDTREPVVTDLQGVYRGFLREGRHFLRLMPASVPTEYALGGAGPVALEVMPDRTAGFDFPLARRVGSIEGDVIDDRTGSGMPGVKVFLSDRVYTYTDDTGAYRIRSLSAGEYVVRIDVETLPFGYRPVGVSAIPVRVDGPSATEPRRFRVARPVRVTEF